MLRSNGDVTEASGTRCTKGIWYFFERGGQAGWTSGVVMLLGELRFLLQPSNLGMLMRSIA